MNQEQAEALARRIFEECPYLHTRLVPHGEAYQVWIWSDKTERTPLILQSQYDWVMAQTYRDCFVLEQEELQGLLRAYAAEVERLTVSGGAALAPRFRSIRIWDSTAALLPVSIALLAFQRDATF